MNGYEVLAEIIRQVRELEAQGKEPTAVKLGKDQIAALKADGLLNEDDTISFKL